MNCYFHPEVSAVAACVKCGKNVCASCATKVGDKIYCSNCVAMGLNSAPAAAGSKTNTMSIISLILGILTIPLSFCLGIGFFTGLIAVILGIVGNNQIKKSNGAETGGGMAVAGIVMGALFGLIGLFFLLTPVILALMGPSIGAIFSNVVESI